MKKALLVVTTGLALILAGCGNNSTASQSSSSNNSDTYKTEMTKGANAVNKEKYATAADHFESAVKAKKTDKASAYEKQANNLVSAKKSMNKLKFSAATKSLKSAKNQANGNKKMTAKAKSMLMQVEKIQKNRNNFKLDIKNAKAMIKSNSNDQARSLLEQVTNFQGIKGKYYADLYKQANDLLKTLPAKSINASNDTTSNSNNDNNSSSSSSSSDDQSNNPAAKGDFDVESRTGQGKEITDADIAKARQQLTDQGVKTVGAWSDNDIIRAIKNARADGRDTIKPSDAQIRDSNQ